MKTSKMSLQMCSGKEDCCCDQCAVFGALHQDLAQKDKKALLSNSS